MTKETPQKPKKIAMESSPDLETTYANLARIAHSPADIVLEFAHLLPGAQKSKIEARIVMTPMSAKLLLKALSENLARYEASYGKIGMPKSNSLADNLFRPFLKPGSDDEEE